MTPDDIIHLAWVGDPQLSPDGTQVAYVVTRVDEVADTYGSRVWRMPVDAEQYRRMSPLANAAEMTTPLLIIHILELFTRHLMSPS